MNINLTNSGEDSYMTTMNLNYPRNLQFKRIQKVAVKYATHGFPSLYACFFMENLPTGLPASSLILIHPINNY